MPGATSRNYPYPLGPEPIDVAGDVERLARSIDTDTGNLASRVTGTENVNATQGTRLDSVEATNGNQESQLQSLHTGHASQQTQLNLQVNRTFWLRENANDQARFSGLWYGSTNGNGEFWVVAPYGLQISTNSSLVQVADINIGAWCVVVDGTANSVHGRLFSQTGFVANLALTFSFQIAGNRSTPFPT
jgi:hypothetical protein